MPENPNKPYDMREIITRVVDDGHWLEIQQDWAQNMLIGFARIGGYSVGIVANQPAVSRGMPRYRRVGQGGALRTLLRLLQYPAGDVR